MTTQAYEAHKKRAAARQSKMSAEGREIGSLPPICDPARRAACEFDFRLFCETYLPAKFPLAWSPDHLDVIRLIEDAVLRGGLFAMAMPRGSGKSTLCEAACLWAILYGHRKFPLLVGAEKQHAIDMLDNIKADIEQNDLLLEDFPEVCFPVVSLDGINQRAGGQTVNGEHTNISWKQDQIILPTIPGAKSSGAILRVAGITGRIRGLSVTGPDGAKLRPDLVMLDDPQTDESARSASQCESRERILAGAILGLGGPGKKIAGLMTVTVIQPDDMADRILDRKKHPQWQGKRTKLIYDFPINEKLWDEYALIRKEGLENEQGLGPATAFYLANRSAMDEGARVAWPERHGPDEASAVQNAMNLKLQDEDAFFAEYQNEPRRIESEKSTALTHDQIARRVNRLGRGVVPKSATRITAFIDVQEKLLYYCVVAFADDFTGAVVEYGAWPEQTKSYYVRSEVKRTLMNVTKGAGYEAALMAGLQALEGHLFERNWPGETGSSFRIERCLIDANFGKSTETVRAFCRRSKHASILWPSHGRGIRAKDTPMSDVKAKAGERVGKDQWKTSTIQRQRHVLYDTNFWKSFVQARLSIATGDPGSLTLYGRSQVEHRMFTDHLTAELPQMVMVKERRKEEWALAPGRENDWLDCLVGCHVAAAMGGVSLVTTQIKKRKVTRRGSGVSYLNV